MPLFVTGVVSRLLRVRRRLLRGRDIPLLRILLGWSRLAVGDGCRGHGHGWWGTVDISSAAASPDLLHQGDDDDEDRDVEEEVADGDPVLEAGPVIVEDDPEVLDTDADSDHHPGDQETMVPQLGSEYQHEATDETEEGVKDSVLDDGPQTDVLATVLIVSVDGVAVADDVEDGGHHGEDDLHNAHDDDRLLQRHSKHRLDTGRSTTHGH